MKRLAGLLLLPALAFPAFAAEPDWFDRLDRDFKAAFDSVDAAFDRALKDSVASTRAALEPTWGTAAELPGQHRWVGYAPGKDSRIVVDYATGDISIESLDLEASPQELARDLQEALSDDSQGLDDRDQLRADLVQKIRDKWAEVEAPEPSWRQSRELAALADRKARARVSRERFDNGRSYQKISLPMIPNHRRLSAERLREPVNHFADKYNLPRALVLSMIQNESSFNPRARSHTNAIGLMQLVPTSGGKEAWAFLTGRNQPPGMDVLYDPVRNIELGTTYLHILETRYFKNVRDPLSRRYLMIAAYNTGPSNAARAFVRNGNLEAAARQINRLSPKEVFRTLKNRLPYEETRVYLARVERDMDSFASWDRLARHNGLHKTRKET